MIRYIILLLTALIMLTGCQVQPPKSDSDAQSFSKTLDRSAYQNKYRKKAEQKQQETPDKILKGLTPKPSASDTDNDHEQRFDIEVNQASARSFFKSLVKGTDKSIMLSPDLQGKISLDLKNVTIPQVLAAVQDTYGYEYKRTHYGYKVYPPKLETEVFHVNYLNVKRNSRSQTSVNSGQLTDKQSGQSGNGGNNNGGTQVINGRDKSSSAPTRVRTDSKTDFWKTLESTLNSIVGEEDGRHITLNPQAGLVTVKAYPDELRQVKKYLDTIQNTLDKEVIIEARVLEVQLNAKTAGGIDLKFPRVEKRLVNEIIDNAQSATATFANPFSFTFSSDNSLQSIVKVLSQHGEVNVLSSPRVATANNQPAVIKVGQDEFFVTDIDSNQVTGAAGAVNNTQDIELTPFFSGIALDVTPHISDDDQITLHVHPVISDVDDQTKNFTVGGQAQNLPLALSSIRESDSIISAKSGQIIVIGGLMKNESDRKRGTMPIISRIPIIGSLVNNDQKESSKTELIIILKPVIVNNHQNNQRLHNAAKRFDQIHKQPYQYKWQLPDPAETILNEKG